MHDQKKENSSLAIVSSVLFPHHTEVALLEKRTANAHYLPGAWIEQPQESTDIDLLKQTIASLRKETQQLEETDELVKKNIQIVARKRRLVRRTDEDDDIYIVVPSDFIPTKDQMKAAGLDGWEWVSSSFTNDEDDE
ncbi:uncharacterized protein EV154DRAFT_229211 [Mucor mucedo]|uniref:Uncharacterized protein n=1 Tax=Mucor saturninus TaxID=64648 RepID=A0A8H7V8C0_9FUNG|nr:uncharacterized protein EV154DRAFT_229211 [Mucor mucedo]KAG2213906.1 hypothetical protein INT47_001175 [Mucor saturninus]KAI7891241.1 hypothetical protein EV154DRAFT_229211 [Mucor mucedo]